VEIKLFYWGKKQQKIKTSLAEALSDNGPVRIGETLQQFEARKAQVIAECQKRHTDPRTPLVIPYRDIECPKPLLDDTKIEARMKHSVRLNRDFTKELAAEYRKKNSHLDVDNPS